MSMFTGVSALHQRKQYDHLYGKKYRTEHREAVLNYQKDYRRTWGGWLTLTYSHMRVASKKRGHPMPAFTKQELWWWLWDTNRAHHFSRMHQAWLDKGCSKWDKPSIDRIDNNKGYSLDNIRLTTWRTNKARWERSRLRENRV